MKHTSPKGVQVTQAYWGKDRGNRWKVTNQQVNGSEEGEIRWYTVRRDKSGSKAETGQKRRRDRYGLHMGSSGSAREHDWVVGLQILTVWPIHWGATSSRGSYWCSNCDSDTTNWHNIPMLSRLWSLEQAGDWTGSDWGGLSRCAFLQ